VTAAAVAAVALLLAGPAPDTPLPRSAQAYAGRLALVTESVRGTIDAWPKTGRTPEDVELWSLYQQRLYLALGDRPALARRVLALLPPHVRPEAADILEARLALGSLTSPTTKPPGSFRTRQPLPAAELLGYYREAERRTCADWAVLAAVNFVETAFGRVVSPSSAGAEGPMQFLPATWRRYGRGGNVHDPHDAILGAADYLCASGYAKNPRAALLAYNHSPLYVTAVLAYARRMRADPRTYYAFHAWQVFVRTPTGRARLTGPKS
jgi:hypothetical protein